jgi:hypothetical protein
VLRRVGRPKAGEGNGANSTVSRGSTQSAYLAARLRRDPEALAKFREEMKHQGERTDFCDIVTEVEADAVTGNSRAYSIARVQRECDPETVAAVMAGEVLAGMEKNKGGRPSEKTPVMATEVFPPPLSDLGVTENQSKRWQREAKAFLRDGFRPLLLPAPTLQG